MKKVKPILIILSSIFISYLLLRFGILNFEPYIKNDFLFTFIGVLIGFALSLFTHIVGLIDKLKSKYLNLYKDDNKKRESKTLNLYRIYEEMKDDIWFLFLALLVLIVLSFSIKPILFLLSKSIFNSRIDFALFREFCINVRDSIRLSIFFLCIYTIKDIIYISFELSKYVIFNDEEN